jgi:hypothetical protein
MGKYALWSTSRGGWLTAGAFTTTELDKADQVGEEEAVKLCRVHSGGNTMNLIPVDYLMIKEIRG